MAETAISLIGVVVGFVLGQAASLLSAFRQSRRRRRSTRSLVSLEAGSNLELLSEYWRNVSLEPDEDDSKEIQGERYARRALEIPLPSFADVAWSSHLHHLPEILSEAELVGVWHLYNGLSSIRVLHAKLAAVRTASTSASHAGYPRASRAMEREGFTSATFETESAAVVFDLRQTVESTLEAGNPLATS
jgi:hypothetical protein